MSLKHRHYLGAKKAQEILEELKKSAPFFDLENLDVRQMEVADLDTDEELFLLKGKPVFLRTDRGVFPTLLNKEFLESAPSITVDAGAVPHICNGSALMAPGVVKVEGRFEMDTLAVVKEVTYGKAIAIVKPFLSSEEMVAAKKGRVATNIHFVGDKLWNAYKSLG